MEIVLILASRQQLCPRLNGFEPLGTHCSCVSQLALDWGFDPVVPPRKTRFQPWEYNREMYKKRNEIKCLFRRLKGFRRIFSRFDKLDVVFRSFLVFALICEGLR